MNSESTKPAIVLVHGAFADGSCRRHVIPLLERDGFEVTAVQRPLTSLADDVATTRRLLDAQKRPTVAVGHSYGGAVITNAATGVANVKALVYVAAFAPEGGERLGELLAKFGPSAVVDAFVPDAAGFVSLDRAKFRAAFAADVGETERRAAGADRHGDEPVGRRHGRGREGAHRARPLRPSRRGGRGGRVPRGSRRRLHHRIRDRRRWRLRGVARYTRNAATIPSRSAATPLASCGRSDCSLRSKRDTRSDSAGGTSFGNGSGARVRTA